MNIQAHHLIPNTLQIPAYAKYFAQITNADQLKQLLADPLYQNLPHHILGTGSNTLFIQDFPGLVLQIAIKHKLVHETSAQHILIELGAGEDWPTFVTYAVDQNWGGIENLALIPGTVGAAPVQNIAAYGQNFEDTFYSLTAFHTKDLTFQTFHKSQCQFGYRDSFFKRHLGEYIITSVTLQLNKQHQLETNYFSIGSKYESIKSELEQISTPPYTIKDVYQSVVNIRTRQLPDWNLVPTAGSFFKNPLISLDQLHFLQTKIPELQVYPANQLTYKQLNDKDFNESNYVKVPAGRILDHLGWKGKQVGNVTTFPKHALIITHNGQATGAEILNYIQAMQATCKQEFDLDLEPEINII